jgi:hypothetical protein
VQTAADASPKLSVSASELPPVSARLLRPTASTSRKQGTLTEEEKAEVQQMPQRTVLRCALTARAPASSARSRRSELRA